MRKVSVLFCVLACLTTSCGGGGFPSRTITVQVDAAADYNGVFPNFFPTDVVTHPGDSVTFTMPAYHGEPHTITLGTMIDAAVTRLGLLGPGASLLTRENTREMALLPAVFPRFYSKIKTDPIPNLSAINSCFLDKDQPANSLTGSAPGCPKIPQPEFNGTQSYYNLGLIAEDNISKTIHLSKTIRPGTYNIMCLVHRSLMIGHLGVAPKNKKIFTPTQLKAEAKRQIDELIQTVSSSVPKLAKATPATALAGVDVPSVNGLVAQYGPAAATIRVGDSMSWTLTGNHSISFGITDAWAGLIQKVAGGYDFNPKAFKREGVRPPPPAAIDFPPADNGRPVVYDAGTYNGTGIFSTGMVLSVTPVIVTIKVTFSRAGRYDYRCTVHPAMKARVTVR